MKHAQQYKDARGNWTTFEDSQCATLLGLEGKKIVVVGMGNSACDIAVDVSRVADKVRLRS